MSLLKTAIVKKLLNNDQLHTLQSESKTHVHTLQLFDNFFKKMA